MANKRFIYNKDKHEKMISVVLESGIGEELSASFPGFSVIHIVNRFRKEGRMSDYLLLKKLAYGGLTVIPSRKEQHTEYIIQIKSRESKDRSVHNYICDYREIHFMPEKNCYKAMDDLSIRKQLTRIGVPESRFAEFFQNGFINGSVQENTVVTSYPDGMPLVQDIEGVRRNVLKKYQNRTYHFNRQAFVFSEQQQEQLINGYNVTLTDGDQFVDVRYNVFAGGITPLSELGKALREAREELKKESDESSLQSEEQITYQEEQEKQESVEQPQAALGV